MSEIRQYLNGWRIGAPTLTPVALHIAVVDPLPLYEQGVVAVLGAAGHQVETPRDLPDWLGRVERAVVLLTVRSGESEGLLSRTVRISGGHHLIAVVDEGARDQGVRALRAGAHAVLWRTAPPATLRQVVEVVSEGHAVLPRELIGDLTGGTLQGVSAAELAWLRALADGSTVTEVAAQSPYSERDIYRKLRSLYARMGVTTRTQAIVRAQELGWLAGADRSGRA